MNKTDLINGMAENAGITKAAAKKAAKKKGVKVKKTKGY